MSNCKSSFSQNLTTFAIFLGDDLPHLHYSNLELKMHCTCCLLLLRSIQQGNVLLKESFLSCFHSILQIIKVGVDSPPAVCSSSLKGQWCIVEPMSRMDKEDFMIHLSW